MFIGSQVILHHAMGKYARCDIRSCHVSDDAVIVYSETSSVYASLLVMRMPLCNHLCVIFTWYGYYTVLAYPSKN